MKKLAVILMTLMMSTSLYASPVATFAPVDSSTLPTASDIDINIFEGVAVLPADTQTELNLVKNICFELFSTVNPIIYDSKLTITQAEYDRLYKQRLSLHNSGSKPLPVRYLPYDYDNNMIIADATGTDRTVMYEVVMGYPVFYKISRYERPQSFIDLQNLPDTNSDKLNTSATGFTSKVGTLYL